MKTYRLEVKNNLIKDLIGTKIFKMIHLQLKTKEFVWNTI